MFKALIILSALLLGVLASEPEIHTYGGKVCKGKVQAKIKLSSVFGGNVDKFGSFKYVGDDQAGCGIDRFAWNAFGLYQHHDRKGQFMNAAICEREGCQPTQGQKASGEPKRLPANCIFAYQHFPIGPTPPGKNETEEAD